MTRILIIDDERDFADDRAEVVARTSDEGIAALQDGHWDEVWLDYILVHDDTLTVAQWVEDFHKTGGKVDVDRFIVHSSSSGAKGLLASVLEPLGYEVVNVWDHNDTSLFGLWK